MLKPLVDQVDPETLVFSLLNACYGESDLIESMAGLIEDPCIHEFAQWLTSMDDASASYWLGTTYASLIHRDIRKQRSTYFTPPELADWLLRQALDIDPTVLMGNILDPACGGAAFLVPTIEKIRRQRAFRSLSPMDQLLHLESTLHGVDIDPVLVRLTRSLLNIRLRALIEKAGYLPNWKIGIADGLAAFEDQRGQFDLVLSNPPYRKLKRQERDQLLAGADNELKGVIKGQANLYTLFMQRSISLARDRGVICLVTPMSFFSGRSFSLLRKNIREQCRIVNLDLIHDKTGIFFGAEQDTALTTLKKGSRSTPTQVRSFSLKDGETDLGRWSISLSAQPWMLPRSTEDKKCLDRARAFHSRLGDYGYVAVSGSLVDYRDTRSRYNTPVEAPEPDFVRPLIWAHEISMGGLDRKAHYHTHRHPFVDVGSDEPVTGEIRQPAIALQRVTTYSQPRRLIAAPVPVELYQRHGGVIGENHVIFLVARENKPAIPPEVMARLLGSYTVDRLFRCVSGTTNVSIYELEQLPLPTVDDVIEAYEEAGDWVQAIDQVTGEKVNDWSEDLQSETEWRQTDSDCQSSVSLDPEAVALEPGDSVTLRDQP